jgi:hypothetical protein
MKGACFPYDTLARLPFLERRCTPTKGAWGAGQNRDFGEAPNPDFESPDLRAGRESLTSLADLGPVSPRKGAKSRPSLMFGVEG